jgi:hypothetical protein
MGTTLNGTTPQNTYPSLIKVGDNGAIDATLQRLSDGLGNDLPLLVSTTSVTNYGSGAVSTNTAFGASALNANTTGEDNLANGYAALAQNNNGSSNIAVGRGALYSNVSGNNNVSIGKDCLALCVNSNNTAVGNDAGLNISSGQNNTALGCNTGKGITTGSNNTIIGANVTGLNSALANNIILADGSGTIRIQTDSSGATSLRGNALTNFVPSIQTTSSGITIDSTNQDTYCGAVLEVTGALTITFDTSIRNGFNISVIQKSANSTTFAVSVGLTLRNRQSHTKTFGQWSTVTLYKNGSDLILAGDTTT